MHCLLRFSEDTSVGGNVYALSALDPDDKSHPHGKLQYSITEGNTRNVFSIDEYSGQVIVATRLGRLPVTGYHHY